MEDIKQQYPKTFRHFTHLVNEGQQLIDIERTREGKLALLRKFLVEADKDFLDEQAPFSELTDVMLGWCADERHHMEDVIDWFFKQFYDEIYNIYDAAQCEVTNNKLIDKLQEEISNELSN